MSRTEDEKQADDSASRSCLNLGVDAIPDAVVVADVDTGEIVDANAAAGELFHCQPTSLVGRDQLELHPSDRAADYAEAFQRGIEGERVDQLQDGEPIRIKTLDGQYKPVEINACRRTVEDRSLVLGVFREVTARLKRQRQLEATTAQLETLLDVLPVPVAVVSTNGTVELWNQAAEETFGYAAETVVGATDPLSMNTDTSEQQLNRLLNGEVIDGYETVYRAKDGTRVPVEVCARPLYEGGTVTGVIVAGIDISDRRQRIQQLDILHRVMRHNLRNKIDAIQGWANVINDPETNGHDAATRIAAVSQDLLELSEQAKQIRAGLDHGITNTEAVELETIITSLTETVADEFSEVTFTTTDDPATVAVPAQTRHPILQLGRKVLECVDEGRIELGTDVQDRYVIVELAGTTRLLPAGECSLIRDGEETALRHGNDLTTAQVYLSVQSIGGNISLPAATPSASTLCLELPQTNPDSDPETPH